MQGYINDETQQPWWWQKECKKVRITTLSSKVQQHCMLKYFFLSFCLYSTLRDLKAIVKKTRVWTAVVDEKKQNWGRALQLNSNKKWDSLYSWFMYWLSAYRLLALKTALHSYQFQRLAVLLSRLLFDSQKFPFFHKKKVIVAMTENKKK